MTSQSYERIIINPIKIILTLTGQIIQLLHLIPNNNTFKSNTQRLWVYTFTSTAPQCPMVNGDNFYQEDLGVTVSPQHPKFFPGMGMTLKWEVSSLHLCSFGVTFTHLLTWSIYLVFSYWSLKSMFYSNFTIYGQFYFDWIFFPWSLSYLQNQFYQW